MAEQWRAMAAFAYTSGGWIGQVFALASSLLVARWTAQKPGGSVWPLPPGSDSGSA